LKITAVVETGAMKFIPTCVEFFSFAQKLLLGTRVDKPTWQYDRRILEAVLQMYAFNWT
jgi:hypothetical protein